MSVAAEGTGAPDLLGRRRTRAAAGRRAGVARRAVAQTVVALLERIDVAITAQRTDGRERNRARVFESRTGVARAAVDVGRKRAGRGGRVAHGRLVEVL